MDELIKYLKKWQFGETPGPYILDINPTDSCNLHCISCWQRNKKFEGKLNSSIYELSDERILELIDEAHELNVKQIEITGGGEPLMRKSLPLLIEKIKNYNIYGSLTSNGTLFSEDLVKRMVSLSWDKIVFSIDGGTNVVQDNLRGREKTFEKNEKTLLLFKKFKTENNNKKPIIHFNSVISNINYNHLDNIIKFAAKSGVEAVNFETLTIHSKQGDSIQLSKIQLEEFQKSIQKIKQLAIKLNIKTNIEKYDDLSLIENSNNMNKIIKIGKTNDFSAIACFEPWYHMVVKVDGSVGPCCVFTEKKVNVKTMSLSEIWYGKFFNNLRKDIKKAKLPSYCKICNAGQLFRNEFLRTELKNGK